MKKILVLSLSLLLLCGTFAACAKKQDNTAENTSASETAAAPNGDTTAVSIDSSSFIDIYALPSPAREAALLLVKELELSPLGFDATFTLEKLGTFTDTNGDTRDYNLISFQGEPLATISDVSAKDSTVLFNCINDAQYPLVLYVCSETEDGWSIDKNSKCIPENYADIE